MRKSFVAFLLFVAFAPAFATDFLYYLEFPLEAKKISSEQIPTDNDKQSLFARGVCYKFGIGVQKNPQKAVELFTQASFLGSDEGKYALAICMMLGEGIDVNTKLAKTFLTSLVKKDFAPAVSFNGYRYANGIGIKKSLLASKALYQKAKTLGSERAIVELARIAGEQKDTSLAKEVIVPLRDLVSKKNIEASYVFGVLLLDGIGVHPDIFEANRLFALCQDYPMAQFKLAMNYLEGKGVVADINKGVALLKKSANGGYAPAINNLAVCYQNGYGVEKNLARAVQFFKEAAQKDYATAQNNLAVCYLQRLAGTLEEGVYWLEKAAENGETDAWENLARCYIDGIGVDKNPRRAIPWLKNAITTNSVWAKTNLGRIYIDGIYTEQNLPKGIALLSEATEANDAEAMLHLGACYYTGAGLAKDVDAAVSLFRKSAKLGNKQAREVLRKIGK